MMDSADRPANEQKTGPAGRLLALDMGEKRIGVAVSDERQRLARSLLVFNRTSRRADFDQIARLLAEQDAVGLVIGLPLLSADREGRKAAWIRDYAADLAQNIRVEIILWDESYSTVDAEASMRVRGIGRKKRRQRVDAVAAAFILQSYLNSLPGTPKE